jgi:hypothetical protein
MSNINRNQALLMIPAIIDGEVSESERAVFFDFIKNHPDIEEEYQSALYVKEQLRKNLKRHSCPEHLKNNVLRTIEELKQKENQLDQELHSVKRKQENTTIWHHIGTAMRYVSAAAVILIITLLTLQLLDKTDHINQSQFTETVMIEQAAAGHFLSAGGALPTLDFSTSSIIEAKQYLQDHHGMSAHIPEIEGATFMGMAVGPFTGEYNTPVLAYTQEEISENIYLFVFDMNQVNSLQNIIRHTEAAEHCKSPKDYFVAEIENHHVVSWLWDDYWYSAVSNHNGDDLASLVKPLN